MLLLLGSLLPLAAMATGTKPQNGQGTHQRVNTLLVLHMLLLLQCCMMHSCSLMLHAVAGRPTVNVSQLWPEH
jgi:hypothetical protein